MGPTSAAMAHPLRAYVRSAAELQYIATLGNADVLAPGRPHKTRAKLTQTRRDENGERISQDQQAAIIKALQALEAEQEWAFEQREAIAEKTARVARKLAETNERADSLEQDNAGVEQHALGLKNDIAAVREEREKQVAALEGMQNDDVKAKLVGLDVKTHKLRQDIRETDRALKAAIWSSSVASDAPLATPLEVLAPLVLVPRDVVAPSRNVRKKACLVGHRYAALADAGLADLSERLPFKTACPDLTKESTDLDVFQKMLHMSRHSVRPRTQHAIRATLKSSRSVPAFRTGVPNNNSRAALLRRASTASAQDQLRRKSCSSSSDASCAQQQQQQYQQQQLRRRASTARVAVRRPGPPHVPVLHSAY